MENPRSQSTTDNHRFFQNLLQLTPQIKSFFDKVIAAEENIFSRCNMAWLNVHSSFSVPSIAIAQLERQTILTISTDILTEAAQVIGDVMSTRIKIDSLDQLL